MVCSKLNIATAFYSYTCTSLTNNCLVITYKCRFLVNVYECLEVSECPYRCACSMCNVHVQYVIYIVDVMYSHYHHPLPAWRVLQATSTTLATWTTATASWRASSRTRSAATVARWWSRTSALPATSSRSRATRSSTPTAPRTSRPRCADARCSQPLTWLRF